MKTVEAYNGFCAVRHDAEFAKDPAYLREVKTGPFYAIKSVASSLGTLGGIKANERFEVVTQDETPIRGLYAAGNDVGGMYGDSYDLLMAGSTAVSYTHLITITPVIDGFLENASRPA